MSGPSRDASRLTGSGANREQILEPAQLVARPDADDDVAGLDACLGLRGRVERAVPLAERDDDRARLAPDVQVANRAARAGTSLVDLDLRHVQVGPGGR